MGEVAEADNGVPFEYIDLICNQVEARRMSGEQTFTLNFYYSVRSDESPTGHIHYRLVWREAPNLAFLSLGRSYQADGDFRRWPILRQWQITLPKRDPTPLAGKRK